MKTSSKKKLDRIANKMAEAVLELAELEVVNVEWTGRRARNYHKKQIEGGIIKDIKETEMYISLKKFLSVK